MTVRWVIERRHNDEWARLGGSKRRYYYSAEAAELKAKAYRMRHPHRRGARSSGRDGERVKGTMRRFAAGSGREVD
ncbi:MAG: hypothetical protein KGI89_03115 [Euryarchaeota archaeon]|nr:hypothetical protein [Euryarchaeota archaeon]